MKNGSSNKIFGPPAQAARFLLRYVLNKLIEVFEWKREKLLTEAKLLVHD